MKKIYYILITLLAMSFTFTACSDEEPFSTATADDDPRILDPIFPDGKDGNLPVIATIDRDANFTMKLTVTPADYTTVSWQIDGHEVGIGTLLDIPLKAGTYMFKVMVSISTNIIDPNPNVKSTYREGTLVVKPLSDDPWATQTAFERIIVPGSQARFYGDNLDKVKSIIIDGKTITGVTYVEDGNYIEYTVPEDAKEGTYRVILVDADNNEYGGNNVTVTRAALITSGADRTNANREWTMTGVNLDQITSFVFAGVTITDFIQQTPSEIVIMTPNRDDGEYPLTGKTSGGADVQFYHANGNVTEKTVIVSSEIVLWEGHHYVSWDLEDGDPNKTFNLIGKDVFETMKPGAVLSIHYSLASADAYHKMNTTTGWWGDLPGYEEFDLTENGVKTVVLTQEILNLIQEQGGFQCVGHGYYVDMVTVL